MQGGATAPRTRLNTKQTLASVSIPGMTTKTADEKQSRSKIPAFGSLKGLKKVPEQSNLKNIKIPLKVQKKSNNSDKGSLEKAGFGSPLAKTAKQERAKSIVSTSESVNPLHAVASSSPTEIEVNDSDTDPWTIEEKQGKKVGVETGDISYEMAMVEVNVVEAQKNMDQTLSQMLSEGRITARQREIYSAKFELMLQGLVSFQEREMEVIEGLNTKSDILNQLKTFVAFEASYKDPAVGVDSPTMDQEAMHSDDRIPTEEDAMLQEGLGRGRAGSQGLSIAEMSATAIRENLLLQKNKIEMQEHMKNVHILELRQLEFEKALLDIHYSKMTKPADVQRETKELKRAVNDLQMEASQTSQEIQQYERDLALEEKALQNDVVLIEKLDLDVLTKQMQVQSNANKPVHLAKEADRDADRLEQLNDEYEAMNIRYLEDLETFRGHQSKLEGLMAELHALVKEETRLAQLRKYGLHESDALVNQLETLMTREQQLHDRSTQTSERITNMIKIRKKLQEDVYAVSNETNKTLREASKLERTLRMNQEAHINAKLAYEKMRLAFDSARPKDASNNWEKLVRVLHVEIQILKKALNQKLDDATLKAEMVDMLQKRLNLLYDEQVSSGKELQNLIRTTVKKRREREEKSEQCIKLEGQILKLTQDSKMLKLILDDCGRSERDLHRAMDDIKLQYNKIKIARSALMNDLILAKQKVSEQSEKLKISNNEIESYTNQCMEREREIHRAHYLTLNASLARDSIRNHAMRCRDKYAVFLKEKSELSLTNSTLRKEIHRFKLDINAARKRFEEATHKCNKTAMQVRERTEEICIVTEKTKAYDLILLRGKRALSIREMEKTKLASLLTELMKRGHILVAKQPNDELYARGIEKLRREFYEITLRRRALETKFNDVSNPERVRNLRMDLLETRETVPMLQDKLMKLEEAYAMSQCQGLEKELVMKQIAYVTEESMQKANLLKEKYKERTTSLCSLRKQLYRMSFKIDGMISETSIAITQADLARHEYDQLKDTITEAESRFARGLAPLESMLAEWNHLIWRNMMLQKSKDDEKKGFLVEHKRPKGSQIIMERLRPKRRAVSCNLTLSP